MLFKKHFLFIICLLIFLLFLARNPFSTRTLIPNFEPYPDTIHYVVPARNFVMNSQFAIVREERAVAPRVPPLYSIFLIPIYMLNNDPRFFYFGNVLLALLSFFLYYLIIDKLIGDLIPFSKPDLGSKNRSRNEFGMTVICHLVKQNLFQHLLLFFPLFLYVTNYFNYWYPTLAMSENLTIFLFLFNIYILAKPINKYTTVIGGFLPFSFFITKYAHAPLTAVFLITYGVKICMETGWENKKKLKKWSLLFIGSVLSGIFFLLFFELIPNVSAVFRLFTSLLPYKTSVDHAVSSSSGGGWFSVGYIKKYMPDYIRALFGGYSVHFLWDNTPIVPLYIGLPGMIGLIWGTFYKQTRLLAITLLSTLVFTVLFMSTFATFDMRYLYQAIPAILIGFVMFCVFTFNKLQTLNSKSQSSSKFSNSKKKIGLKFGIYNLFRILDLVFRISLVALLFFYLATNIIRFKKQIMLNLKYAETPWYYLSVLKLNEYFKSYPKNKPVPVLISSQIPYFIDFYSNGNYSLLPLSLSQEIRDERKQAWGNFDYSDLIKLYYKVLLSGHELYIHNYGLGNEKILHDDFKKIQDNFFMAKVADGCYGTCDIWQLKMKWGIEWLKNKK